MQRIYGDHIDNRIVQAEQASAAERAFADSYHHPDAIARRLHQWRERFNKL